MRMAWLGIFVTLLYVLVFYPGVNQRYEIPGLIGLTAVFVTLRFWIFPKIQNLRQLDWFSFALLIPCWLVTLTSIHFSPQGLNGVEQFMLLTAVACLVFYSNAYLIVWLGVTFSAYILIRNTSEKHLTPFDWLNTLVLVPWFGIVVRSTVDASFRALVGWNSEKQRIVNEFNNQTEQMTAILERAPLILCVMDKDGVYTHSRGSGLSALSLGQNEVVGLHYKKVFEAMPHIVEAVAQAESGEPAQVRADFGNGTHYEIRYEAVEDENGKHAGVIGVGVDVSQRVYAEMQERAFERKLFRSEKNDSLGTLAGGVAHDFNNYLMSIVGFCESMGDSRTLDPKVVDSTIDLIKEAALQAAGVSKQMLVYASNNPDLAENREPTNLVHFVEEGKSLLQAIVSKNTALGFRYPQQISNRQDLWVSADAVLLQQAIVNVIRNANDALEGGNGSITVEISKFDLALNNDASLIGELDDSRDYCQIATTDSGKGIPREKLDRIFDLYFTTKTTGHGIGLAVTGSIVKNHGGAISCESEIDRGTTIRLIFPLLKNHEGTLAQDQDTIPMDMNQKRVLLVDDEPTVLMSISMMLESKGCQVVQCDSGQSAIKLLSNDEEYDCIILDYTMPNMNGMSTLQKIRALDENVPVILCSGLSFEIGENPQYEYWPNEVLQKPFQLSQLFEKIELVTKNPA